MWDVCGYVASGLVLAAFYMKDIVPLRLVALLSNLVFIVYGVALDLTPIWVLHALLVPLNWYRLVEAARARCHPSPIKANRIQSTRGAESLPMRTGSS